MKHKICLFTQKDLHQICLTAIENNLPLYHDSESIFNLGATLKTPMRIVAMKVVDRVSILADAALEAMDILVMEGQMNPLSETALAKICHASTMNEFVMGFAKHIPGIPCYTQLSDFKDWFCPN